MDLFTFRLGTGKALVGLRREIHDGRIGGPVVFWHTGGGFAVFASAFDYGPVTD